MDPMSSQVFLEMEEGEIGDSSLEPPKRNAMLFIP